MPDPEMTPAVPNEHPTAAEGAEVETPRTNEREHYLSWQPDAKDPGNWKAMLQFARQLERDLITAEHSLQRMTDERNRAVGEAKREGMEAAAKLCDAEAARYKTTGDDLHARGPLTFEAEIDRWYCRANQARRSARDIRAALQNEPQEHNAGGREGG